MTEPDVLSSRESASTSGADFLKVLERFGISFLSGVPCSYFAGPLQLLTDHPRLRYLPAANEGSALAAAAGSWLAGSGSAVLAQNSGFGNLVNPLTSLLMPYRIPVLVIMSMRGWPSAAPGEEQHRLMGKVVPSWLDTLEVPHWQLTRGGQPFADVMAQAAEVLAARQVVFVLVGKGAIEAPGHPDPGGTDGAPAETIGREELARALVAELRSEFVLSTTGFLSRAAFAAGDRPRNLYMQGAMGHVTSLALGAAMRSPGQRFVVLDGDGALLMHLGAAATIGSHAPPDLIHVVFDNGAYESTGGQSTGVSVDFGQLALAVGYRSVFRARRPDELVPVLRAGLAATGPVLLLIEGAMGGASGPRASEILDVEKLATRFRTSLTRAAGAENGRSSSHLEQG